MTTQPTSAQFPTGSGAPNPAVAGAPKVSVPRTRWERLHPIRAGRLWRCRALGIHHPVIVDMGQRKVCLTCNEWDENGR